MSTATRCRPAVISITESACTESFKSGDGKPVVETRDRLEERGPAHPRLHCGANLRRTARGVPARQHGPPSLGVRHGALRRSTRVPSCGPDSARPACAKCAGCPNVRCSMLPFSPPLPMQVGEDRAAGLGVPLRRELHVLVHDSIGHIPDAHSGRRSSSARSISNTGAWS